MPTLGNGYTDPFGSGLVDGDYLIHYLWCDDYNVPVTISCDQITWIFDYCVPNPTITKHFMVDLNAGPVPKEGLPVTLYEDGVFVSTEVTDAFGTVTWDGYVVGVCHDYTLEWTYGGITSTEGPIHFGCPPDCLTWEQTNLLEPKSGGG